MSKTKYLDLRSKTSLGNEKSQCSGNRSSEGMTSSSEVNYLQPIWDVVTYKCTNEDNIGQEEEASVATIISNPYEDDESDHQTILLDSGSLWEQRWFAKIFQYICMGCTIETTNGGDLPGEDLKNDLRLTLIRDSVSANLGLATLIIMITLMVCDLLFSKLILLFRHDIIMQDLRFELHRVQTTFANGSQIIREKECSSWSNLTIEYRETFRKIEKIASRLTAIGMPARSFLGVWFFGITITALSPFVIYCWPTIYISSIEYEVIKTKTMALIIQPKLALRLLSVHLSNIMHDLSRISLASFSSSKITREQTNFQKQLIAIQHRAFIRPQTISCLFSSKWRLGVVRFSLIVIIFCLIFAALVSVGAVLLSIGVDILRNTQQRMRDMLCKYLHGSEFFLVNPIVVSIKPLRSEQDRLDYNQFFHDYFLNKEINLIYYGLVYIWNCVWLEFKYYIDPPGVLTLLELFILLVVLCVCISFWNLIYLLEYLRISTILFQVLRKLTWCSKYIESSSGYIDQYNVETYLTVALINYEYFRRQFRHFQVIIQLIIYLIALLAASVFLPIYFIASHFEADAKVFYLFVSVFIVIILNIYLTLALYTPRLIESIMKQVLILSAQMESKQPQMQMLRAMQLWRKLLMDTQDITRFSGVTFLGFSLTYRNLIAMNVNIVGLFLLMWRVFKNLSSSGQT